MSLITTTSINGKSIQYDRLSQLKFIGYTHGYGTGHITEELYSEVKLYTTNYHPAITKGRIFKRRLLSLVLNKIGLNDEYLKHGQRRGIYVGFTGQNSKDFLLKRKDTFEPNCTQSADNIFKNWVQRWDKQRYNHLIETKRIM